MIRVNRAKEKLLAGELVVGTHLSFPSPAVAELCGLLGFDFIIVDMEHVLFNPETFTNIVRAAENSGTTPVFRPTKNDPELMLPYLDSGAMGVWIPGVASAADARAMVEAVKYRPLGKRGMTSERVASYRVGISVQQIVEEVNRNSLIALSIEDQNGIDNLEAICAVEGVDVVGLGPLDLSQALGHPGQIDHPEVQKAIADILGRVRRTGRVAGITAKDAASAKRYYDMGARYVWTSVSGLLTQAGNSYLSSVRSLGK